MVGITLDRQGVQREIVPPYFSVKEAVFPFARFPGVAGLPRVAGQGARGGGAAVVVAALRQPQAAHLLRDLGRGAKHLARV